jgi:hydroxymethylglutaryl-CoA synthase
MEVGIVSYGAYVPRYRITPQEIGRVWGSDGEAMSKSLMIYSKSVPAPDEDVITIATEAAKNMMKRVPGVDPKDIGALYVGSESHPYAVKPSGTIVAEAIGCSTDMTVADFEFACKAGTAAIQTCMGLVGSGMVKYGVAIGADTSQGAPGDPLEYSASAGGASFLIGAKDMIAVINHTSSFTTDTPDFWRREGQDYPSHGGRFTGEPAYFKHVTSAAKLVLKRMSSQPADYQYAVFHQPNGKFPQRVAKMLGFTDKQVEVGLLTPRIGNTYS